LLCAYEYIPAHSRKIKLGGEFNSQGPVQGRFDAEISLQQPHAPLENSLGSTNSDDLRGTASAPGSLGYEAEQDENTVSTSKPSYNPPLAHLPSKGRKGLSNQWIPIGWNRLAELFQAVQVLCHCMSIKIFYCQGLERCWFGLQWIFCLDFGSTGVGYVDFLDMVCVCFFCFLYWLFLTSWLVGCFFAYRLIRSGPQMKCFRTTMIVLALRI
jgi:hypothetical protein